MAPTGRERRLKYYELMMVVSPQADEEGLSAALDRVNRYVSEHGGSLVRQEQWGRLRRLAYPIRNFNEGNYVLSYMELDPQDTRELEAGLMLSEDVLTTPAGQGRRHSAGAGAQGGAAGSRDGNRRGGNGNCRSPG